MARPDPFMKSRMEKLEDYTKDKVLWPKKPRREFFRVYNSQVKSYVYFIGYKVYYKYKVTAFYYKGSWYRKQPFKGSTTFQSLTIDPALITVKKAGIRTQKKLLHSLWNQYWVNHV